MRNGCDDRQPGVTRQRPPGGGLALDQIRARAKPEMPVFSFRDRGGQTKKDQRRYVCETSAVSDGAPLVQPLPVLRVHSRTQAKLLPTQLWDAAAGRRRRRHPCRWQRQRSRIHERGGASWRVPCRNLLPCRTQQHGQGCYLAALRGWFGLFTACTLECAIAIWKLNTECLSHPQRAHSSMTDQKAFDMVRKSVLHAKPNESQAC